MVEKNRVDDFLRAVHFSCDEARPSGSWTLWETEYFFRLFLFSKFVAFFLRGSPVRFFFLLLGALHIYI